MKKYKVALFIGRFEPFHNGHLYSLEKCIELADKVVIAVGSSQESGTENNPWSYAERKSMIASLLGVSRKVEIVAIPDVFNDDKWGKQIEEIIQAENCMPSEVVGVGNNEWTNRILRKTGIAVYETGLYKRDELEGIKIRKLLKEGDMAWKDRVPSGVAKYLEEQTNAEKS